MIEALIERFGECIRLDDGNVSRSVLRSLFLNNPDAKRGLEEVFHHRVRARYDSFVGGKKNDQIAVADIPLLYETGNNYGFDKVIVVACRAETQLLRLKERSSLDTETAKDMISQQLPIADKIKQADFVLWNEGSPTQLNLQIDTLTHHLFK